MTTFSDYITYADESGDHGLENIDPEYPVFVLAFCIFQKDEYAQQAVPAAQRFKFKYFGHDIVIMQNHKIRKSAGEFSLLLDDRLRKSFMEDLNSLVSDAPFTLVASIIDKNQLVKQYKKPENPYAIAMEFCLERAYYFLKEKNQADKLTHLVVESRGRKEDRDLELEFRRICQGDNFNRSPLPFRITMADKKVNSIGLQLADLVAYPIGRQTIRPASPYPPYQIIEGKFRHSSQGVTRGWGLKHFP